MTKNEQRWGFASAAVLGAALTFATLSEPELPTTNYYFSTANGNDSRTATQAHDPATPWQTIGKLNSVFSSLQPGDSIFFNRGEKFYGSITVAASGTSAKPIYIGAYGSGAKPVITSMRTLSSWSSLGASKYETPAISTLPNTTYQRTGGVNSIQT
jgi:hypothetical protein